MPPQTALVVDDSKLARITLQRLLEKRNFRVKLAESAQQALDLLSQELPDIIFMDHLMPEMDGFEAMQRIKTNPATQHIPVVMCTGKEGTENYDAEAKSRGASATLAKPPQPEQLAAVLDNLVVSQDQGQNQEQAPAVAATIPEPAKAAEPLAEEEHWSTALLQGLEQLRRELHETHLPELADQLAQRQQAQYQTLERQLQELNGRIPAEAQVREWIQAASAELQPQPSSEDLDALASKFDEFQNRLAGLEDRFNTLEQARQEPAALPADTATAAALDEVRLALEARLDSLNQDLAQVREAAASQVPASEPDVEALEQRLSETLLASVGPTLDAMLAHKTEQIRNQLLLDLETSRQERPEAATEDLQRLAKTAVSEELGHASEQLVAEITQALREEVEATQRELLARQEMFEQERTAMRRQIRQLRSQLLLTTVGIGLLAILALAAGFSF